MSLIAIIAIAVVIGGFAVALLFGMAAGDREDQHAKTVPGRALGEYRR